MIHKELIIKPRTVELKEPINMSRDAEILEQFKKVLNAKDAVGPEGLVLQGIGLLLTGKKIGTNFTTDIAAFHLKYNEFYQGLPRTLPEEYKWRIKFIKEELKEYKDAVEAEDIVKQFDALLDILYVVFGTLYLQGLPVELGWSEVHASNMTKEVVEPGLGKFGTSVHKGINYVPPDLARLLGINQPQEP